jgi:hypothetical protein
MALAKNDLFTGTWNLKSHQAQPPGPAPKTRIHNIEATAATIRAREKLVTARGCR